MHCWLLLRVMIEKKYDRTMIVSVFIMIIMTLVFVMRSI